MNTATSHRPVTIPADKIGSAAIGHLQWPSDTVGITAPPMTRNVMPLLLALLTRSGADITGSKPSRAQAEALCVARLIAFNFRHVVVGQAHTLPDDVIADLASVCDSADVVLLLVADPVGGSDWLLARRASTHRLTWDEAGLSPVTVTNADEAHATRGEEDDFPVDVPHVDFHFFVDAVTRAFDEGERERILTAFDNGALHGLQATVTCDAEARVLLADAWKQASGYPEALTLTRGIQAGLFHQGILLKMDISALDEFISGGYARPVDDFHHLRLRRLLEPWKALAASLFLAGHSPHDIASMSPTDMEQASLPREAEAFRHAYLRFSALRPEDKTAVMPTDVRKIRGILRVLPHLGIPADVSASTLRARTHGAPASPGWHPRLSIRTRTLRSLT